MKCRNCGKEIPARLLKMDSFKCPACGKVYRRRPQSQQTSPVRRKQARTFDFSILQRKLWKLPVWAWLLILVAGIIGMIMNANEAKNVQVPVLTPTPEAVETAAPETVEPGYTPPISEDESAAWEARFHETEGAVQNYLEDKLAGYSIRNLFVDYYLYEPDIYAVMFDATLQDGSRAGLKAAIEDMNSLTPDYQISFGVMFYDNAGNALGAVSWGTDMGGRVNMAVNGKGYEFDSVDALLTE